MNQLLDLSNKLLIKSCIKVAQNEKNFINYSINTFIFQITCTRPHTKQLIDFRKVLNIFINNNNNNNKEKN